jgi:hypothetical protein
VSAAGFAFVFAAIDGGWTSFARPANRERPWTGWDASVDMIGSSQGDWRGVALLQ